MLSQAAPELAARKAIGTVLGLREPSPVTGPVLELPLTCGARERTEGISGVEASIIPDRAYMSTEMSSRGSQLHLNAAADYDGLLCCIVRCVAARLRG